jgi:hypothetical protein
VRAWQLSAFLKRGWCYEEGVNSRNYIFKHIKANLAKASGAKLEVYSPYGYDGSAAMLIHGSFFSLLEK